MKKVEEHNTAAVRRRGEELAEAIRTAIREELAARGYADLTFEGVAKRAQTSKPVLYRRYRSRAHMVIDAWAHDSAVDPAPSSTGTLREDLLALGRALSARLESLGIDTVRGLLAEVSPQEAEHLAEITTAWAPTRLATILHGARERGEIGAHPLPPRVQTLPLVLARHELLLNGTLDDATITELVDTVCLPLLTAGALPES